MVTNAGGTASMKDGPTLLKMVTMLTYIDIRATTVHIPESLIHMKMQLMIQQGNITEFNDWVMEQAGQLAARGNIAPDLLTDSILYFFTFIPFLLDIQSVYQNGLCTGNRGFSSEAQKQIKVVSAWETEGLVLTDVGFC